jgi:uncharacterized protein YtpQ (UPF0354 family)
MQFIKLIQTDDDKYISININHIVAVKESNYEWKGDTILASCIYTTNNTVFKVDHSRHWIINEIVTLLNS